MTFQLPQLPEPEGWRITDGEGGYNYTDESPDEFSRAWAGRYNRTHEPLFTAEQMRAALETGAAAGRNQCSRELLAMWHATHNAHPHGRSHYHEGYLDALDMAAEKFKA